MSEDKFTPPVSMLYEFFPEEALQMERVVINRQLREIGLEYRISRKKFALTIDIPTSPEGLLRITATEDGSGTYRKFFHSSEPKRLRLPGGKVVKSEPQEVIHATVEFLTNNPHDDVTYLLREPNFAEIVDTAIESLAQVDGIYVSLIEKKRNPRRNNPHQPELGAE